MGVGSSKKRNYEDNEELNRDNEFLDYSILKK